VSLVEGLLMYLADEVADRILAELTRASAPHGQLLVEHLDTRMMTERGRAIQDAVEAQNTVLVSARRHSRLDGWPAPPCRVPGVHKRLTRGFCNP
jgi:O-methyltransferase involved in polyketide biosynthesis